MTTLWGLAISLPMLALGGVGLFSFEKTKNYAIRFARSRKVAAVLTVAGWLWTAYECDTIGIAAFDMFLKAFPCELWIMAAVLSYLTIVWMKDYLVVRALSGLMMLMPAELFKTTRLLVPASGFAIVHILVGTAYVIAVVGMYGMFYPWRLEKLYGMIARRPALKAAFSIVMILWALAVFIAGVKA